jgi:hypothetical protein
MSHDPMRHVPTPVFRASLENEIVRTLRRETQFEPTRRPRRHDRVRSVVALACGLLLGVGVQFASAQVADARQRSDLERAIEVDRGVAGMRLNIARTALEQARQRVEVGALSRQVEMEAAAEVRMREMDVGRLHLDLLEVRATAAAPRDELWAPLVGGRDFVRERLTLRAAAAQQRLSLAEGLVTVAERAFRAGAVTQLALSDAQSQQAQVKEEFQVAAQRLMLRDEFLKEGLSSDEVTRRARRIELISEIQRGQRQLELATARLSMAQKRSSAGAIDELELKRAEVEVLERTIELGRLRTQWKSIERREE